MFYEKCSCKVGAEGEIGYFKDKKGVKGTPEGRKSWES